MRTTFQTMLAMVLGLGAATTGCDGASSTQGEAAPVSAAARAAGLPECTRKLAPSGPVTIEDIGGGVLIVHSQGGSICEGTLDTITQSGILDTANSGLLPFGPSGGLQGTSLGASDPMPAQGDSPGASDPMPAQGSGPSNPMPTKKGK